MLCLNQNEHKENIRNKIYQEQEQPKGTEHSLSDISNNDIRITSKGRPEGDSMRNAEYNNKIF